MVSLKKCLFLFLSIAITLADVSVSEAAAVSTSSQRRQNLVTYSEQLDNAIWATQSGITLTPDVMMAPDGTMTADRISFAADSYFFQSVSPIKPSVAYTYSVWVYAPTSSKGTIAISMRPQPSNVPLVGKVVTLSNKWTRYSFTVPFASGDSSVIVGFENRAFAGADNQPGFFYAWGAQLAQGTTPGAYNKAEATAINTTYVPTGVTMSSQRGQNLLTNSEQINSWSSSGLETIVANNTMAPDGTMTVERITYPTSTGYVYLASTTLPKLEAGMTYTGSIWLWTATKTTIGLRMFSSPGDANFEVSRTINLTTTPTRYSLTSALIGTITDTAIAMDLENRTVYKSNGDPGIVYAWGAQIVPGSFPGAYNKTGASAVNPTFVPAGRTVTSQKGQNQLLRSEEFDNSSWAKRGGTTMVITADAIMNPVNGKTDADLITGLNGLGSNDLYNSDYASNKGTAGTRYTPSIWIKRVSTSGVLRIANPQGTQYGDMTIDLSTIGDGWVRIFPGARNVTVAQAFVYGPSGQSGLMMWANSGGPISFYAWGAQIVKGTSPGAYNRTAATAFNSSYTP